MKITLQKSIVRCAIGVRVDGQHLLFLQRSGVYLHYRFQRSLTGPFQVDNEYRIKEEESQGL